MDIELLTLFAYMGLPTIFTIYIWIIFRKSSSGSLAYKTRLARRLLWIIFILSFSGLALLLFAYYEYYFITRWAVFTILGILFHGLGPWLATILICIRTRKILTNKFILLMNVPFLSVIIIEMICLILELNGLPLKLATPG